MQVCNAFVKIKLLSKCLAEAEPSQRLPPPAVCGKVGIPCRKTEALVLCFTCLSVHKGGSTKVSLPCIPITEHQSTLLLRQRDLSGIVFHGSHGKEAEVEVTLTQVFVTPKQSHENASASNWFSHIQLPSGGPASASLAGGIPD